MTRRGVKGFTVNTKTESAKRRLTKLAKRAREKKAIEVKQDICASRVLAKTGG
jgi:hypothetical protein